MSCVCADPVVVIRPGNAALAELIAEAGLTPLPCPDADLGMGHSLAFGAARIPQGQAILVMLADLPFVRQETLTRLLLAHTDNRQIVVPSYHGRRGHPVLFGSAWRKRLLNLTGDTGARAVTHDPNATVIELPVDDAGTVHDIDTPSALAAFEPPSV